MEAFPAPAHSLYAGSKAYIHHFSSALDVELQNDESLAHPIDVFCISPGFVSTKLNGMPVITGLIPTPLSAARSYLKDVGRFKYTNGTILAKLTLNLLCFADKYLSGILYYIFYNEGMKDFARKNKTDKK